MSQVTIIFLITKEEGFFFFLNYYYPEKTEYVELYFSVILPLGTKTIGDQTYKYQLTINSRRK